MATLILTEILEAAYFLIQKYTTKDLHGYLENSTDSTTIPKHTLFEVEVTCHLSFNHSYWHIKPHGSGALVPATDRKMTVDLKRHPRGERKYARSVAVE